ncbi:uncharacterized protein LOC126235327 [Schistocerca nitens]|uniref:uncharacterized protein LOC126235327 n=1 Tax=Schistocerca nitens TaxID=7011 RepID=UPI002118527F|nr:uncharacterized protein LOC126235327 [Schistocerca nitens]
MEVSTQTGAVGDAQVECIVVLRAFSPGPGPPPEQAHSGADDDDDALQNDDTQDTETKDEDSSQPSENNVPQTSTTSSEETQRKSITTAEKRTAQEMARNARVEEGYQILRTVSNRDEWSVYGEFIANEMRNFSLTTQTFVKHITGNALFRAAYSVDGRN